MTDSLRQKQIREILDVWQNVGQQVFQREKRQAQVMEEGVLPKKQKDYETEVGITKGVEGMNRLLETKLFALENALTSNSGKALSEVMSVAETVNGFNALVRLYSRSGLDRDSQESAKVTFQDMSEDISAVVYGYEQLLDMMFSQINPSPNVLYVMRAASVYRAIKAQLYESHSAMAFSPLTQGDIQNAYKDFYAEQSQERRDILNRLSDGAAPERTLTSLPLRNFPVIGSNIDERIAALEAEHGLSLSDSVKKQLRQIQPSLASSEFAQFEAEHSARKSISTTLLNARMRLTQAQKAQAESAREIDQLEDQASNLRQMMDAGVDADGNDFKEQDLNEMDNRYRQIENEIRKKRGDMAPLQPRIDGLIETIRSLESQLQSIKTASMGEYQRQKAYDPSKAKDVPMPDIDEKTEVSASASSSGRLSKTPNKSQIKDMLRARNIPYTQRDSKTVLLDKLESATRGTPQRRPASELRRQQVDGEVAAQAAPMADLGEIANLEQGEGYGKPHRQRGLASLRRRYGHHESSSSDSESDMDEYLPQHMRRRACEFDDSRNDMYD